MGNGPTGDYDFPSEDQARQMCRSNHKEHRGANQEVRLLTHVPPPVRKILRRLQ